MTSLTQSIRIRCPVENVVATAEDPKRWDSWYVGLSEEETITSEAGASRAPWPLSFAVCLPFPLTQNILEHHADSRGGRWKTRSEGATECCKMGAGRVLIVLAARQTWSYEAFESGTEVTAELDFQLPRGLFGGRKIEAAQLECLEGSCLDRSLKNLRQLCEAAGTAGVVSTPAG